MKFNWGTGIVIAMIVMVSGMLVLVSIALRQDYDLVDDDYYQKSINYQQHIEKVKNNEALPQKIKFEQADDTLTLAFPRLASSVDYKGTIHFYSPVEENRDLTIELRPDTGFVQTILLNKLEAGRYQVKIDWNAGSTAYYHEQEITVER
jgi:hypothetical protein